jgi:hypothetical protein
MSVKEKKLLLEISLVRMGIAMHLNYQYVIINWNFCQVLYKL